jgi:hypothetical protein
MRLLNSSAGKPFKLTTTERACSQVVASLARFFSFSGFAGRSHAHFPVLPVAGADQMAHFAVADPNRQAPKPQALPPPMCLHPLGSRRLENGYLYFAWGCISLNSAVAERAGWWSMTLRFKGTRLEKPRRVSPCAGR